jgi:ankyrin repeat protein
MNTPLHDAAAAGDAGICAMLLSAGAAVEARASVRGCAARRLATGSGTALLGATSGAPRAAR